MKNIVTNPILLYVAIAILLFLYVDSCSGRQADEDRYLTNLEIKDQKLREGKTKLGQVTAQKDALIVTADELQEQVWVKDDSLKDLTRRFRKVNAAFIVKSTIDLKPGNLTLELPNALGERTFRKATPHYIFSGAVLADNVRIDTLSMFNTQRLVLGVHKGFFNRTLTAEITNSNPYIKTTDLTTQVLTERVKRFGVGPYVGYGVGQNFVLTPQVGIGLSYDLLRF